MKFVLKTAGNSGRLGIISNIVRLPDFELETPHAFLYTIGGTVPHITPDVLHTTFPEKFSLNIPFPSVALIKDRLKLFNSHIGAFIGMKNHLTYCSFINAGQKYIGGFHEKDIITIWTRQGRKSHTAKSYIEFMEAAKPDMYLALADGDTNSQSSAKRIDKATNNSLMLFQKCMDLHNKSEALKSSEIIGALEGGFDLKARENMSKVLGESPVFGVVVDGLHDYGEDVAEMSFTDIKPAIQASLKHIPKEKLRIIHGCWNPSVLLDLVELGVDMFDTSYPYVVAEQGCALVFPNTEDIFNKKSQQNGNGIHDTYIENFCDDSIKTLDNQKIEPNTKKPKLMPKYYISMRNSRHIADFSPILQNCNCYTCKNHTKAYLHHLLNVQELLGPTLLMIHNLHHYFEFLSTLRKAIKDDRFGEMKKAFQTWHYRMEEVSSILYKV